MPMLFLGYFYMTWWCVSLGLLIAAFSERSVNVRKDLAAGIIHVLAGFGAYVLGPWLPTPVRSVLLAVMPALPCYEMIRAGIFGPVMRFYYDDIPPAQLRPCRAHLVRFARAA